VNFEWDPGKARWNRRKHRISFPEAATVFGDWLRRILTRTIRYRNGDSITVGMSSAGCVLMVSHADRDENISQNPQPL